LNCEGVVERKGIPREVIGERGEALHAKEINVRLRDEWLICLVEPIDVNRKKTMTGKGWRLVGRMLIGRRTIALSGCTLRPASVLIIPNDIRHRRAGSHRHHLRDAVQAVVAMEV
jgi:hypothetical protein